MLTYWINKKIGKGKGNKQDLWDDAWSGILEHKGGRRGASSRDAGRRKSRSRDVDRRKEEFSYAGRSQHGPPPWKSRDRREGGSGQQGSGGGTWSQRMRAEGADSGGV